MTKVDEESAHATPLVLVSCGDLPSGRVRALDALRKLLGDDDAVADMTDDPSKLSDVSLFGEAPLIISTASREAVGELAEADLTSRVGGLAVVTTCNGATSEMRVLKQAVKAAGGIIIGKDEDAAALIDGLPIRDDLKRFLHEYTSDSYDKAKPIATMASRMGRDEAMRLDMDDIIARIPQIPGERLPWGHGFGRDHVKGLDELLLDRDAAAAHNLMDRILSGGLNANMVVSWLMKTWREDMEMTAMAASGEDWGVIAGVLGLPDPKYRGKGVKDPKTGKSGYPTYRRIRACSKRPLERMMRGMREICRADDALKGRTMEIMDDGEIMTRMVARICA